ncbi:unnamed protein product [marine sediment metagenome]|uniref:Uncharacterized protein n=1 Tax=marine sediment metagenome TaxID=412755 RepID=X1RWE7_9ZZZZ
MDAKKWLNKGNEFAERGNYQKAIEAYDKAIEIDPQNAAASLSYSSGPFLLVYNRVYVVSYCTPSLDFVYTSCST